MNHKLLKQLMKQAETECGFDPNKFAELIVQECANLTLDYKTHDHYMGWVDHGEAIAQHFGIER